MRNLTFFGDAQGTGLQYEGTYVDIVLAEIGLSSALQRRMRHWQDGYLGYSQVGDAEWAGLIPVIEAHELVGLQIAADLQAELGADYKVAFFSDLLRRRVYPNDSE